ncbi:hypothetical protein HK097_007181 [Rhizophlyctis rosea]|uniref:RING-type domain-containing protein n=1 Tax=Rhizophlyctis rosea TaxID=64517 RepID=A0AAD5SBZ5_9FUNG|nr:hypothetical protein HK097_007181 [Rhizophlyctis rosea]
MSQHNLPATDATYRGNFLILYFTGNQRLIFCLTGEEAAESVFKIVKGTSIVADNTSDPAIGEHGNQVIRQAINNPSPAAKTVLDGYENCNLIEDCEICFEDAGWGVLLDCNHRFHRSCLYDWFAQEVSCPKCREMPLEAPKYPSILWAQRTDEIFLTITIRNVKEPKIELRTDKLYLEGRGADRLHKLNLFFEDLINPEDFAPWEEEGIDYVTKNRFLDLNFAQFRSVWELGRGVVDLWGWGERLEEVRKVLRPVEELTYDVFPDAGMRALFVDWGGLGRPSAAVKSKERRGDWEAQRQDLERHLSRRRLSNILIREVENGAHEGEVTDADRQPTYFDAANGIFGCKHYQRAVKLQAHCCGKWDACRFCHDEVSDHDIIRNLITTMMCMYCGTVQPAAQDCANTACGKRVAKYYCKECKVWDSDPRKNIYHCKDCKKCRKGKGLGIDRFHCKRCDTCISMELREVVMGGRTVGTAECAL